MDTFDIDNLTKTFTLLSNPIRLKIFLHIAEASVRYRMLVRKHISVKEFAENTITGTAKALQFPRSTASTYLKTLKRGGLICSKRTGRYLYWTPKLETFAHLKKFTNKLYLRISL